MNPKHRKKISQTAGMGEKKARDKCSVSMCTAVATTHMNMGAIEGMLSQLHWELKKTNKKSRRIGLCKKHNKAYKKIKDKDEKYSKFKNFGPNKIPKHEKTHAFME